jgi:hypothetical protein
MLRICAIYVHVHAHDVQGRRSQSVNLELQRTVDSQSVNECLGRERSVSGASRQHKLNLHQTDCHSQDSGGSARREDSRDRKADLD